MNFYQEVINLNNIEEVKDTYERLLQESISSSLQLEDWLVRCSRVEEAMEEALTGHYIEFQCYSNSDKAVKQYEYDQVHIEPLRKSYTAALNKKFLNEKYLSALPLEKYKLLIKSKKNAQELFQEENIYLEIEEDKLVTNYFEITGSLTAEWDGEEKSLSELSPFLEDESPEVRKKAMFLINEAFQEHAEKLQKIMSDLIQIRRKKAENANEANYRDFMFKEYERFDYTSKDCFVLAEAVKQHVTPLKEKIQRKHKHEMQVENYRPWDRKAPAPGQASLKPFHSRADLVEKASIIFSSLDESFSKLLNTMDDKGMLDLTARKGKAPGGFCTPLPLSGTSFIFMNASQTHDDMITLLHEMGHCIHNDFTKHFSLAHYKETPMESAELASMTMELLTMDHWHHYYTNKNELIQAKKNHLRDIVDILPLGIVIDQFQHWMYENPNHSEKQRMDKFLELQEKYDANIVDWDGFEEWRKLSWLRILHIFEVPFYFIEYVIAQLGALQIYRNYKLDPVKALQDYKKALHLGASVPLPDVYEAAGISFDFSSGMISELMQFVENELEALDEES